MLFAALMMLGLGLVLAGGLAFASRVFYVEADPRIEKVLEALPGANCGGCGQPGCGAMAEAIVKGLAPVDGCVAGGADTAVAVGAAMGVKVEVKEPRLAQRYCNNNERAGKLFEYDGAMDCVAVAALFDGDSKCVQGCLGLGSCVEACAFDAIRLGDDGLPKFNAEACRGCGMCVRICPHGVIQMQTLSSYLTHLNVQSECLAPCRQLCPAQIDIPEYIKAADRGDYETALRVIKDRNPLPSVCGRVCPAPCETQCRRQTVGDEPVFHNIIKRYVADWERLELKKPIDLSVLPNTGKRIAIVGGGPAGLSAAQFLRRLGHSPTIYDAQNHLGGMLRFGIPEYRLPKAILDWDIKGILDLGVEAKTGVALGKDITLDQLEAEYDAVLMAVGAWISSSMRVEGEDMEGVWGGIDYLMRREQGKTTKLGNRVAIIGGGNTAIDASRSALRDGAKEVTLIYRRTLKEMPANPVEIHAAQEEGVKFMFLTAPVRVVGENGKMRGLEVVEMGLGEPDASGRRRPVPKEGSEKVLELDSVIAAIGQSVDGRFVSQELKERGVEVSRWGTIQADPNTLQTGLETIFVAGDGFTGPDLVVSAIGGGRQAARAIHQFLTQGKVDVPNNLQKKFSETSRLAELQGVQAGTKRQHYPELDATTRTQNWLEVDQTVSREVMKTEAMRCLRCGTVCYSTDAELRVLPEHARRG